jgi:hypothetical protein
MHCIVHFDNADYAGPYKMAMAAIGFQMLPSIGEAGISRRRAASTWI